MCSVAPVFSPVAFSSTSCRVLTCSASWSLKVRVSATTVARCRMWASSWRTPSMVFFRSSTRMDSWPARSAICRRAYRALPATSAGSGGISQDSKDSAM